MEPLHCIHSEAFSRPAVSVSLGLEGDELVARYEVSTPEIHADSSASRTEAVWGLWDHDVVELFVCADPGPDGSSLPYYEFQVSPLDQFFELEILKPRKETNRLFRSKFSHQARITRQGWNAEMRIPLRAIGWKGDPSRVSGNAFAILGKSGERSYFSLFIEKQDVPDFHLPERFRRLLKTSDRHSSLS
jgi:hypothetical protein